MFYETDLDPEILDLPKRQPGRTLPLWEQIALNKLREEDDYAEAEGATWD